MPNRSRSARRNSSRSRPCATLDDRDLFEFEFESGQTYGIEQSVATTQGPNKNRNG